MNKYSSLKKQLERADDETLRKLILTVASASGVPQDKMHRITEDIPSLRKLLVSTDDDRFAELIASLGNGNISELLKKNLNGAK